MPLIAAIHSFPPAFGLEGAQCPPGQVCIASGGIPDPAIMDNGIEGSSSSNSKNNKLVDNAIKVGYGAKNLLVALHELDMSLAQAIFGFAGVSVPPFLISLLGIALMMLAAIVIVRIFIKTTKHVLIIAGIIVAVVLLMPVIPSNPALPS